MARRRRRAPPRFQCLTTSRYLQQVAFCRVLKRKCSLTRRSLPVQDPVEEVHMKEVLVVEAPVEDALIEEAPMEEASSMEETPVEYSSTEVSVNEAAEAGGKEVKAKMDRRFLKQKTRRHRRERQRQAVKRARGFAVVGNVVNNVNVTVENAHTVEMARRALLRFQCVTSRHLQHVAFTQVVKRKRISVQVPVEEVPMEEAPLEEAHVEDYSVVEDCVDKEAAQKEAECVTSGDSGHLQQVAFTRVVKRKRRSLQVPVEEVPVEEAILEEASVEDSSTVEDSVDEEAARKEAECVTSRHLQQVAFTRVVKLKHRSVQVPVEEATVEEASMEDSSVVEDSVDEDAARKEAECVTSRQLQQMAFTRVVKRQRRSVQVPVEEAPLEEVPVEEARVENSPVEDYFIVDDSVNEETARKEAEEQEEAQEAAAVEISVNNANSPVENAQTMGSAVVNPVDNTVVNPVDNSPVEDYCIVGDSVNEETARKEAEEQEDAREAGAVEISVNNVNNAVENAHTVDNAVVNTVDIAVVNPVEDAVVNSVDIAAVNQVDCAMVNQVDCAMVNQVNYAVACAMDYAEDYAADYTEDYAMDCDEVEAEGVALKVTLTSTLPLKDAEIVKRKTHDGIPHQIVNRNFLNSSIGKLTTALGTLVKLKGELQNLMVYCGKRSYARISFLMKRLSRGTKRWRFERASC